MGTEGSGSSAGMARGMPPLPPAVGAQFPLYLGSSVSRADAFTAMSSWVFEQYTAVNLWEF